MSEHLGIHDSLSFEQYRLAAGISRSMLLDIHPPSTPAHFKARHIDKAATEDETPALRMGRFVHLMLTPDLLSEVVIQPTRYPVNPDEPLDNCQEWKKWNWNANYCRDWRDRQAKEIATEEEWDTMHGMWESVRRHDLAGKLLRISDCERSAFARDPDSGLLLKARFDGVPRGSNVLWDLKSCESADEESAGKFVAKWRGWLQAAFYLHVANLIGLERQIFYFVMVEKTPPYAVAVYRVDPYHLEAAARIVRNDLHRLAQCYAEDNWPAYGSGAPILTLPKWTVQAEGLEEVA